MLMMEALKKENGELRLAIHQLSVEKQRLEDQLYRAFRKCLNTKKRKIQELQDELEILRGGGGGGGGGDGDGGIKKKPRKNVIVDLSSSSSSTTDGDDDDETDVDEEVNYDALKDGEIELDDDLQEPRGVIAVIDEEAEEETDRRTRSGMDTQNKEEQQLNLTTAEVPPRPVVDENESNRKNLSDDIHEKEGEEKVDDYDLDELTKDF